MKWTENRRGDRNNLVEQVCECGVGHPVYASALWIAEGIHGADHPEIDKHAQAEMVHGCCGCCRRDDFPGDLTTSIKISHSIIRNLHERVLSLSNTVVDLQAGKTGGSISARVLGDKDVDPLPQQFVLIEPTEDFVPMVVWKGTKYRLYRDMDGWYLRYDQ